MTNEVLLRDSIRNSGYKLTFIANKIGITYAGFLKKLTNETEFKVSEMVSLCKLLNIDDEQRDKIFFGVEVDEKSSD